MSVVPPSAAAAAAAVARPAGASAATASRDEPGALAPPLDASAEAWNEYHARWEKIWSEGCAPGQYFDKASASPTLLTLLGLPLSPQQRAHLEACGGGGGGGGGGAAGPADPPPPPSIDAKGKRALVPGCGRGYDVVAFARAGAAESIGLELSATAAEAARGYIKGELASCPTAAAAARVVVGDFFAEGEGEGGAPITAEGASFDLGYDLTFLCALHPSMREAWADRWSRALRPGGRLVTACYPIDPSRDQNSGPPWPLTPELYERLLLHGGGPSGGGARFRKVYLAPVPRGMSHPERAGQEWLGIWERV